MPGVVLYRFTASVIFYNAPYFKRRVLAVADANPGVHGSSWTALRSSTSTAPAPTRSPSWPTILAGRGIRLAIGGVLPQVRRMLERSGALERLGPDAVFPTLRAAVDGYESRR